MLAAKPNVVMFEVSRRFRRTDKEERRDSYVVAGEPSDEEAALNSKEADTAANPVEKEDGRLLVPNLEKDRRGLPRPMTKAATPAAAEGQPAAAGAGLQQRGQEA